MIKVGVLELQGDFGLHHKILQELGYVPFSVKDSADLESLDGLIIPGGESTTMSLLIDSFNLRKSILDFSKENKKILASHTATYRGSVKNKTKSNSSKKVMKKMEEDKQQSTLGDLDSLAALKDNLES